MAGAPHVLLRWHSLLKLVVHCLLYGLMLVGMPRVGNKILQRVLLKLRRGEPLGAALREELSLINALTCCVVFTTVFNAKFVPALCASWTLLCRGAVWVARAVKRARAPTSASSGGAADPGTELQLVAVTPVLLDHLHPADRLSLWQASRQLALTVWSSSPGIHLILTSKWSSALVSLPSQLQPALPVLLRSKRPSCIDEQIFFKHLQSLSLNNMQLRTSDLDLLTALLPTLRHVSLLNCRITAAPHPQPTAGPKADRRYRRIKMQALLHLTSFSCSLTRPALPSVLVLLDLHTLHSLNTDDPGVFDVLKAGLLPALRVLKFSGGTVDGLQLDALLLAKPQMQEVCLPVLQSDRDHSAQDCSWGLLRLQGNPMHMPSGLHALQLAMLPLAGIQRLVVERELHAWGWRDAIDLYDDAGTLSTAWSRIQEAAERLEFVPGITGWGRLCAWSQFCVSQVDLGLQDDELGFTIHSRSSEAASAAARSPEGRGLLALVARRLQGGTLVYSGADLHPSPLAALQPLHELSSSVHSVVLHECAHVPKSSEGRRLLLAGLPPHVQRLVVVDAASFTLHPSFLKAEYTRG